MTVAKSGIVVAELRIPKIDLLYLLIYDICNSISIM